MYRIIISPRARKDLKSLKKTYRRVVAEIIDELSESPLIGKPLTRELTGRYSYKIGVYRVIYKISRDKKIYIISAGHRATIYN